MQSKHAPAGRNGHQHNGANAQRASQTPQLSLTFPKSPAHHHRAAVQSNEVYPTPPASARRVSFGRASDKRFPLWQDLHNGQSETFVRSPQSGRSSELRFDLETALECPTFELSESPPVRRLAHRVQRWCEGRRPKTLAEERPDKTPRAAGVQRERTSYKVGM